MCLLYILFNGVIGIVVGMVMDILLYNVWEVVSVCCLLFDKLKVEIEELFELVYVFDYLIEVEIIILKDDICKIY